MNKVKWIFFDIGSTLVDESAVYENRISEIACSYDINRNEFMAKVKLRAQTNPKPIISVAADYGAKVPAWRHDLETLYPDAKEVLQKLRQKYKLGIIANQDFGTEQRLINIGICPFIDLVIASAEEGVEKPELRIFQIALDRAGCKPDEAVMVGDRIDNDIIPAKKIGMKTVWIKQSFGGLSEPHSEEEHPDYSVDSLSELLPLFISQSEIKDMELFYIAEYAELFVSVFNAEPWNDSWTKETAQIRIENMMKTDTFIGKALYADNDLKGIIWGQKEQYYDGTHFQIQEFCVKTSEQNKGYGSALLKALEKALSELGVINIYLITSKGAKTEGYYAKRGFVSSGNMVLMTNRSFCKQS